MLKNIVVIIVFCLLVMACDSSGKIEKPDNLIPEEKMSNILYDLYIINAAKGINRKLLEKNGFVPETYVLTKYSIDSTQFADSNKYYAYKTEAYKVIVEEVKARLEKEKEEYEELRKKESLTTKTKRDSIKKQGNKEKDSIKRVIKRKGFD